jgi:osmotically-inducible protein OsmY
MTQGTRHLWPLLGAVVTLGVAGCQDRNNNGTPDAPATSGQIERGMENAGQTVEKGLDKAGNAIEKGVDKAAPAIENAVESGADLASNAAMTGKVKSAIMANESISATGLNVDTKGKVVYLRGSVKNAAQKNLASQIAKKQAGTGYTIKNELKVAGGASPTMKKG